MSGADKIYDKHLAGTTFNGYLRSKPANDRQAHFERMYTRLLTELSANRFRWIGLPDEIPKRFLELQLFRSAFGLFFKDKRTGKFMVVRATRMGNVNPYDDPTEFMTTAINFPNLRVFARGETRRAGKGIAIWANYLRVPDIDIVFTYAWRLAVLDRTIEINSQNARQNKVLVGPKKMQLTRTNFGREYEGGNNSIEIGGSVSDLEFIKAVDLAIDSKMIDSLAVLRTKTWQECMGLLGIDNANQDKKERLVEAEVGANDDQSSLMRSVNLSARQEACAEINRIYGLNVWVDYKTEIDKLTGLPDYAVAALEAEGYTVTEDNGEIPNTETNYGGDE